MIVHDFYLISYFIIVHILVLQALFDLDNNLTMVSSDSTVYIGFWDQPLSEGSRLLNPVEVAKVSGFWLPIATSWLLKAFPENGYNGLSLSRPFWLLNPDWPLNSWSQNPM